MHQPVVHQIVVAEINFVDNVINHASRLFQTGTLQPHIGQCFGINADFAADIYHVHIPVMPFIGRIPQIRAGIDAPDCEMSACGRIVVRSFEGKDFSVGLAAEVMLTFSSLVPETSPLTTSLSVVPFNVSTFSVMLEFACPV